MGDNGADYRSERRISTCVVAMMVSIHQEINRPRRPVLDSVDASLRSSSVLAIYNENPITVDDPSYRPPLTIKDANIAPKILKRCRQLTLTK